MAQGVERRAVPRIPIPERHGVHVRGLRDVCLLDLNATSVQMEHAGLLARIQVGQQPAV